MAQSIKRSVGRLGKNDPDDVRVIQTLLVDFYDPPEPGDPSVGVTGICDSATLAAILAFQGLFDQTPDGRIDPNGTTLKRLNNALKLDLRPLTGNGAGYYSYATRSRQWGTSKTIAALEAVCSEFSTQKPGVLIGIGDISFRVGGKMSPHGSHQKGRNVDIRPLRKDGSHEPVTIDHTEYSHEDTALLADLLNNNSNVRSVLFNDHKVKNVAYYKGHHNHLHEHEGVTRMKKILLLLPLASMLHAQQMTATAEFRTLWWSKEQMRNFDPNRPPPKNTEVVIDRWEYTDPVGVPHPDEITAHVRVRNNAAEPSPPFRLTVEARWKEGPDSAPKKARWRPAKLLRTDQVEPLPANGEKSFTVPIAIKPRMEALEAKNWWPYELEIRVLGRTDQRPVLRYIRPFPIFRGD